MVQVVIADADEKERGRLRQLLEAEGYSVREARNGHDAEELDEACPADILIVDIVMPKRDGIETIRSFRERHSRAHIVAIFAGCRMCGMDFLPIARKLGANTTLRKPVEPEALLAALAGTRPVSASPP